MSEVNGPKINLNQLNFSGVQKQVSEVPTEEVEATPKLTDFSDNKAEALGRSMLFKGTDNINQDLKALLDNPQIAENSDKMFETMYSAALASNIENPYEEAASASTIVI